jgi:hypothetical protein
MECSSEELDYTKNGITSKACCCINICSIKLGVTPAKHRMQIQLLYSFIHLWKKKITAAQTYDMFSHWRTLLQDKPMQVKMKHPGLPWEQS